MYVPAADSEDTLRNECGPEHAIYDWQRDLYLRQRWPERREARRVRCSHAFCVACYHWRALAQDRAGVSLVVASWTHPRAIFERWQRFRDPLVVVRVSVTQRRSQYLGWIPVDRFHRIDLVDVLPWSDKFEVRKRVLTPARLLAGFPRELAEQGELFQPASQGELF